MIAILCRARIKEERCKVMYKQAYAEAMIDDENTGSNKEKREAYAEVRTWKQKEIWIEARSERISAEASLECADTYIAEMELVANLLCHDIDPAEIFEIEEEDE